jgi:GNAT superfamily N-acetyltransferase
MNQQHRSSDLLTPGDSVISVRQASDSDAPALADFNARMAWETEGRKLIARTARDGVAAVLADPGHGFYAVAERADDLVGALLITHEWSDWRNARFWWIQSVYVVPDARRMGVYRALHEFVETRARNAGNVCGLRLYVEKDNHIAQQVYEEMGMSDSGYRLYEQEFSAT